MVLPIGKLDSDLLEKIVYKNISFKRNEVVQRAGIGEDCAVVNYGDYECVMSTDPITGSVEDIGKLAINVTLNDIASNGVEPVGIMLAVMLPYGTTADDVEKIMKQAGKEAEIHEIEIIGGHTEITDAVNRPVIVSTAVGRCKTGSSVDSSNIAVGDKILISKEIGLEGIGIISKDKAEVISDFLSKEELVEAQSFIHRTSVVREGVIAGSVGVDGMHDITEGGLLGAVWEMCRTSGLGAKVFYEKIPVSNVSKKICKIFDIDILRLISSGAMLIIAEPEKSEKLIELASRENIEITEIGEITESGRFLIKEDKILEIEAPKADELYKALKQDIIKE